MLYEKLYPSYTRNRDKIIRKFLRRLKKTNLPLYWRLSTAYWNTRFAKRPFGITPRPVEYQQFVPPTRTPMWNYREEDPYDPPPGHYFLVLDGREYEYVVHCLMDMNTNTIFLWSYSP